MVLQDTAGVKHISEEISAIQCKRCYLTGAPIGINIVLTLTKILDKSMIDLQRTIL